MKVEIGNYVEGDSDRDIDIHIDKWDTYSMDHTLSLIIVPMLIQLRDTNHGHPADLTEEKWIELQNKMIWSFEQIRDDMEWKQPFGKLNDWNDKVQEGLDLFGKHFRNLWD